MASLDATIKMNRSPPGGEAGRPQIAALAPGGSLPADGDLGQPVDIPPPLVVGFDDPPQAPVESPPGERLPRRNFLAPPADSTAPTAVTQAPAMFATPTPVGAIAELAPAGAERQPGWLPVALRRWRAAPAQGPSTQRWSRPFYWARWVAVAIIIVAILYVAAVGPFSRSVPFQRTAGTSAAVPSDPAARAADLQSGARAGDAGAQLQLAILYAKGEGVTQDFATAATWFRAAADQGSARAQYDLGVLYERGRGVPADATQAASWYLKSAEGQYPLGQYNLAVAYTKGLGTRKDLPEAALWYRRAAIQGVVQAMVNLGMLYERGDGVSVSPVDAYAWYLAAGRRGNEAAAKRADDVFNGMPRLDQIRAQALASDVGGSIHDVPPDSRNGN